MLSRACILQRKEENVRSWLGLPRRWSSSFFSSCRSMVLLYSLVFGISCPDRVHSACSFHLLNAECRVYWGVRVCWWSQSRQDCCWTEWRLNKCGIISPRFDIGVKEIKGWTARLLPSRQVNLCDPVELCIFPSFDGWILNNWSCIFSFSVF